MAWRNFEEMEIWQNARVFNDLIWKLILSDTFAKDFALMDQLNRSAGSVMDNIAEGFDGGSNAEYARFLSYTQRSCLEVKSQLARELDRRHISNEQHLDLSGQISEIHRKTGSLIKHLKSNKPQAQSTTNLAQRDAR
jgi:four helix bundle protein